MTMERLSAATRFANPVATPDYDRKALKPGILHFGLGAFHRAHQAVYNEAALSQNFGDWGIVGVSLRSLDIVRDLRAQDQLYSVITRSGAGDSAQVVGSIIRGISAVEDRDELLALLVDPAIKIVTITVTEKAYGLDPVTGGLDRNHPAVAADLANPTAPTGVIGYIVEGLARRQQAGMEPFTVLCCDNLPSNGRVVRRLVLEMAEARDPALAGWIAEHGAFPSSMVDRIVPAATDEGRARAAQMLGAEDALSLETEPFMQWVIEDHFLSDRPAWEAAGALFVDEVEPYEKMKLRLLNGAHSMIAYLGQLKGLEYVRDVMAVAEYRDLARRHMKSAVKTLDPVPGIDLNRYIDQLIERFENPTIAHRTKQIAMDGSQKLPQRIFAGTVEALKAGDEADTSALATALWIAYAKRTLDIDDPRREELRKAAAVPAGDDASAAFFAVPGLFPQALIDNRAWRDRVNGKLADIEAGRI
ncbi:D-mannonate oxidoreductase [Pseudorhizobium pelagicum]|uniref:D-mannonate oxidoreductase n=2 Tax=Pseudorhizobium pelagicum TaxID=1509405 RepID=A0A922T7F0_9HYPH|nr:D-mannonate oxidoreductase [Pseudorhizobium pelagicum]KEQ06365.1 D-mannonate oxidoreductase [Pseudorhizobium pelagicum]